MKKLLVIILLSLSGFLSAQQKQWLQYKGSEGIGKGKHIVFVSGEEEYRSEESLPMMARMLSSRYGFTCTVLFPIDPSTGKVDPNNQTNIPGLKQLKKADLLFMQLRFRELPDEQMQYIDEYIGAGKPIVALRTSTHAFNYKRNKESQYSKYDYKSKATGWNEGFGRIILGETWINHHGVHGKEGTRGLINGIEQDAKNPILNGVKDIWGPSDVYTVTKLPVNTTVLVYGQSTSGMTAEAAPNLEKSVMPVAWTKTYISEYGKTGRVFTTTMGAAVDLLSEDLRRLLVNGSLWALGMEDKIPAKADVQIDGKYEPSMFGFNSFRKGLFPTDFEMKQSNEPSK